MNIAQQIVNGLVLGSGYACIALGWTILLGVARLVNFAHGQLYMLGAFVTWYAMTKLGCPTRWRSCRGDFRACGSGRADAKRDDGAGHDAEPDQPDDRHARPRLRAARRQRVDLWRQSADLAGYAGARQGRSGLAVVHLAGCAGAGRDARCFTVRCGCSRRRRASDRSFARSRKIPSWRNCSVSTRKVVYLLVFVFECSAVALGAALVAPRSPILTSMGFNEVIMTFVVVVLGGIGSIGGALVAGLGLGLFIAFFGAFVAHAYTTAAAFAVLLASARGPPGGIGSQMTAIESLHGLRCRCCVQPPSSCLIAVGFFLPRLLGGTFGRLFDADDDRDFCRHVLRRRSSCCPISAKSVSAIPCSGRSAATRPPIFR